MKCGMASIDITPNTPVELGGFRWNRGDKNPFSKVEDPLYATCFYFEAEASKSLLILLDLIWVSELFCEDLKKKLYQVFGVAPQQVLIAATHTHSSPQLLGHTDYYGRHDGGYEKKLSAHVLQCTRTAIENPTSSSLRFGTIPYLEPVTVNRISFGKKILTGKASPLQSPNPNRPVDNEIRCLAVYDNSNELQGLLYNTSLHPVFNKDNVVSADFPGKVRKQLQEKLGQNVSIGFLQGFAGDLRPNIPSPKKTKRVKNLLKHGTPKPSFKKDIKAHKVPVSTVITNTILGGLDTLVPLPSTDTPVMTKQLSFDLYEGDQESDFNVILQRLDLPGNLSLVGVNGEMFSAYLELISNIGDKTGRHILPAGYTNGMLGYLPDRTILQLQSGYEYDSWKNFGLPKPVPLNFPDRLKQNLNKLFGLH